MNNLQRLAVITLLFVSRNSRGARNYAYFGLHPCELPDSPGRLCFCAGDILQQLLPEAVPSL